MCLGGNNALDFIQRLNESIPNVGEGLLLLGELKKEFEKVNYCCCILIPIFVLFCFLLGLY